MTLILQNDDGDEVGANAYVDVAFLKTYHLARGVDIATYSDDLLSAAIIRATDYLDQRFNFVGRSLSETQTTQWPRLGAKDINRWLVEGIPNQVKNATAEYAKIALEQEINPNPERHESGVRVASIREKVGPIEESTSFAFGQGFTMPRYPKADRMLTVNGLAIAGGQIRRG